MSINITPLNLNQRPAFTSSSRIMSSTIHNTPKDSSSQPLGVRELELHARKRKKSQSGRSITPRKLTNNKSKKWEIGTQYKDNPSRQIDLLKTSATQMQRIVNLRDGTAGDIYRDFMVKFTTKNRFNFLFSEFTSDDKKNTPLIQITKLRIFPTSKTGLSLISHTFTTLISNRPDFIYSYMKGYDSLGLLDKFLNRLKDVDSRVYNKLKKCLRTSKDWDSTFSPYFPTNKS